MSRSIRYEIRVPHAQRQSPDTRLLIWGSLIQRTMYNRGAETVFITTTVVWRDPWWISGMNNMVSQTDRLDS